MDTPSRIPQDPSASDTPIKHIQPKSIMSDGRPSTEPNFDVAIQIPVANSGRETGDLCGVLQRQTLHLIPPSWRNRHDVDHIGRSPHQSIEEVQPYPIPFDHSRIELPIRGGTKVILKK